MSVFDRAENLFRVIENDPAETGYETQIGTGVYLPAGQVRCFKKTNGHIGIVIPATDQDYLAFTPDTKSQAIYLTKLRSRESDHNKVFEARLTLRDASQRPTFYFFVDRILSHLDETPNGTIADVSALLAKWRRFFSTSIRSELSLSSEVGLLCELNLLLELLDARIPGALENWVGPKGAIHDFDFPDFSVECKASTSLESLAVSIHGEHQLKSTENKPLYLEFRRYQVTANGQLSVPILINRLMVHDKINPELLIEKVRLLGCDPFSTDAESQFRQFSPIDEYHFEITEDFPHVKSHKNDNRISSLQFTIDLAGPKSIPGYLTRLPFFA